MKTLAQSSACPGGPPRASLRAVLLACLVSSATALNAGTLTFGTSAPTGGAAAISSWTGATFDADNVGGSGVNANGGSDNGATNDGTTYVAGNRPVQGQTFTTGSNASGYLLTSVTVRMQGYTNNTASGGNIGGYDLNDTGSALRLRVGRIDGSVFVPFTQETAACGGSGNPGQGGTANGPGTYLTFTLGAPIVLAPNTVYGFDFGTTGDYFEMLGIRGAASGGNPYAGGTAYTSGANGYGSNAVTTQSGERAFLVDMTTYTAPTPGTFVHPGLLHTDADFERMRTKVAAGAQPWTSGWGALTSSGRAQLGTAPRPLQTVIRGGTGQNFAQMYIDIARAYQLALRWKVSGDTAYADQAVVFLNAWSNTMTGLTGNSDRFLASGIYGYQWANVGEIMRTYPGWAAADVTKFQTLLLNVFYPMNHDFLVNHNSAAITNYWANWDLCNIASVLAIGVFCDRQDLYNEAVDYFYKGGGNGAIDKAVYYIHPGNLGQWQESGRDQGHTTFGVALAGPICEMAWNQGLDFYSYGNNRILAGTEYVAKYNLWQDVPFWPYAWGTGQSGSWQVQTAVSWAGRGSMRPGFALVYNHYVNRQGLAAPWCGSMVSAMQPEGDGGNGDQLGFGTLTFSRDPVAAASPKVTIIGERPEAVSINWWGSTGATGYNVYRSTSPTSGFTAIATNLTGLTTYTDAGIGAGTYYYKVGAVLPSSELLSSAIQANPTATFHTRLNFDETSGTTAADASGNSHPATLAGGATFAAGKTGNALSLNGTDAYATLPAGSISDLSDFTVAAWVYLNANNTWTRLFDFGDSNGRYLFLTTKAGSGVARFTTGTVYGYNEQHISAPSALPTGQWTHVAVRMAGRVGTLFINGVAVGVNNGMAFQPYQIGGTTSRNYLGKSQYPDPLLNGKIDDFRLYRGAVSTGDLYTLATGTAAPAVPGAPTSLTATAQIGNSIALSWPAVSGATSYTVKRATTSGGPYMTIAALVSGTTFTDTGLTTGTTYYYVISAANNGGDGSNSPAASATAIPPLPGVPGGFSATPISNSAVKLTWSASSDATTYTVKRAAATGGPYTTVASGLTTTTYTDTGLTAGTTYYYVVIAVNVSGESGVSTEGSAQPSDLLVHLRFDETTGTTAADSTGNGWNGTLVNTPAWTTGTIGNAVQLASASSQSVNLPGGVAQNLGDFTICTWVNLTSNANWARLFDFGTGTTNYMFLCPQNGANGKLRFAIRTPSVAEQVIDGTAALPTGSWVHVAVTRSGNTGTLYINGTSVGTNTALTLKPSDLGNTNLNFIGDSQFAADPTINGAVDDFHVYSRALSPAELAVFQTPLPVPQNLAATATSGQIALSWNSVSGATGYALKRSTTSGGPYTTIVRTTGLGFTDTGLADGITYYYVVAASNVTGESAGSTELAVNLPLLPPANLTAAGMPAEIDLGWNTANGATGYSVKRSTTSGGPYTEIVTDWPQIAYADTTAVPGTVYYYVVSSLNDTVESAVTAEVSATAAEPPPGVLLRFDETSGTVAADSSGNGWNGTVAGGATFSAGKFNNAVNLSGSSQYASLPTGVMAGYSNFTIATWVKVNSLSTWSRVFDFGSGTTNYLFLTPRHSNTSGTVRFAIRTPSTGEQIINGSAALPTGAWTHVAVTLSGTTGTLYVNGVAVGTNTAMTLTPSSLGNTTQNYIGRSQFAADPYLNGSVDDLRIYNRALSASQVAALYSASVSAISLPPTSAFTATELKTPAFAKVGATHRLTVATTAADHTYELQSTTSLTGGTWTTIGAVQAGTGAAMDFDAPVNAGEPRRFYRILIRR
ncbi:LamG-like jellyroll fold domain-containing protein [Luteolibacter sp. LG18]|uniref:LamG-like jellyroll fold domain-containing protein n=1 Tax=Luteolibacter sp. LG18 TaxID=2819286 RepID=UPI002B2A9742|nr:hypothetical protein llg_18840 [Luteolibacter sp. LG18]